MMKHFATPRDKSEVPSYNLFQFMGRMVVTERLVVSE